MVRKVYNAPNTIISSLTVYVKGYPRTIHFTPTTIFVNNSTGRGSQYVTSNEELQKALEACPSFGRSFFLSSVEEIATEPVNEVKAPVEPKTIQVSTPAEARDYICENFGVKPREIWSKENLLNKAKELGITFVGI